MAAQQTYARRGGVTEPVDIAELMDNAVAIHFAMTADVSVRREYDAAAGGDARSAQADPDPRQPAEQRAPRAEGSNRRRARADVAHLHARAPGWFVIEVQDSGIGIEPEALKRLFEFGFTTKKDGHGFGLHTSAILAKELGGHLAGFSEGRSCGAQFVLRLPLAAAGEMPARRQA